MVERRNIPRHLSVTLFYPAVLGYFFFEIVQLATSGSHLQEMDTIFRGKWDLELGKWILIIETFLFYCCDFLGSCYVPEYTRWNFMSDIAFLTVIIITMHSLGVSEEVGGEYLDVHVFSTCFCSFMLIYLLRYFAKNRYYTEQEKRRYRRLATVEALFLLFFLGLLMWSPVGLLLHLQLFLLILAVAYLVYEYAKEIRRMLAT